MSGARGEAAAARGGWGFGRRGCVAASPRSFAGGGRAAVAAPPAGGAAGAAGGPAGGASDGEPDGRAGRAEAARSPLALAPRAHAAPAPIGAARGAGPGGPERPRRSGLGLVLALAVLAGAIAHFETDLARQASRIAWSLQGDLFPLLVAGVTVLTLLALRALARGLVRLSGLLRRACAALARALGGLLRLGLEALADLAHPPALRAGADRPAADAPAWPGHLAGLLRRAAALLPEPPGAARGFESRYRIIRALPAGGSTAQVFLVEPRAAPAGGGGAAPRYVVKHFDLGAGSRLEELVRESRALEGARRIGAIVEHHLDPRRFWYVMPFHDGPTLAELREPGPLAVRLRRMRALLRRLGDFHAAGLIHKDVKPQNLIVLGEELIPIDLGLLTDIRSALTLTTHGTEFYRDPEMVELAMAKTRVQDIDARRFDIYSAGAVLYFLLEERFPACGALSRFARTQAPALEWVVRRAMAEGEERYPSALAMREDLERCLAAEEEGALDRLRPSELPSFAGAGEAASSASPAPVPMLQAPRGRRALRVLAALLLALGCAALGFVAGRASERKRARLAAARAGVAGADDAAALLWSDALAGPRGAARAVRAWRAGPLAEALRRRDGEAPVLPPVVVAMTAEPGSRALAETLAEELRQAGVPGFARSLDLALLERDDSVVVTIEPDRLVLEHRGIRETLAIDLAR